MFGLALDGQTRPRSIRRVGLAALTIASLLAAILLSPTARSQELKDDPAPADQIDDGVVGQGLVEALEQGPQVVVVAFESTSDEAGSTAAAGQIASQQDQLSDLLPEGSVDLEYRYKHLPGMALIVNDASAIAAIAEAPGVLRVDLDSGGSVALAEVVPFINADDRHALGNEGDGVVVAMIDTGIDLDHLDLIDDIEPADTHRCWGYDGGTPDSVGYCPDGTEFQSGAGAAEDEHGHGTYASGIISGNGSVAPRGLAPGAKILPLRVTSPGGNFASFSLNVVPALDYIIDNPQLNVELINMSLGTSVTFAGDCDTATSWTMLGATAVDTLRASGVLSVASTGNGFASVAMGVPACLSNVVSVGASTSSDIRLSSSNRSATTDLFAPGDSVTASYFGGGTRTFSGSSVSAAVATGCAALLIESGDATTPDALETHLETSSVSIDGDNGYSYPRLECAPDPTCDGKAITINMNTNGGSGVGTGGDDVILGTSGGDRIRGNGGNDTICGQAGPDNISGGAGHDVIFGEAGADEISGSGGADRIEGGSGPDRIYGGGGLDMIYGGPGSDVIAGQGAADVIEGGGNPDTLGGQNGADIMIGDAGNDTIRGHSGPDTLRGENEDDVLSGGRGADTLYGGAGTDICNGNISGGDTAESATCEQTSGVEAFF